MLIKSIAVTASFAAALTATVPAAAADEPNLLGSFRDWHVYTAGSGAERSCFAVSPPQQTSPQGVNRGSVFFMITSWPGRSVLNQPSVVPGYPYRETSTVSVQIGGGRFEFFTKNDGGTGGAWMEAAADERKLIDAMRRGANMVVSGTSTRGTLTRDNYSLAGISAALDKIASDCK